MLCQTSEAPPQRNRQESLPRRFSRKKALHAVIGGFVGLFVVIYLGLGIKYTLYTPARSPNYLWAVYHVHSTMSDGLQAPEEIARQAHSAGVSLVLLTDHGNPNVEASSFHAIIDGVTVAGGSEAKLPEGRLTFFGARERPRFSLSSFPPQAMDQAREWGGFPVLAYAEDSRYGWRYWKPDLAPGGIELSNLFTCVRDLTIPAKIRLALFYPFSRYYFLKSISVPSNALVHWDEFLRRGKTWGFVAADAHGGFRLGTRFTVKVPSYDDSFSFAGLGIDRKYASDPELAIRNGDFFNCIRGAGEPVAFNFSAAYGSAIFHSGSDAPEGSDLHVDVQTATGTAVRLLLIKNGSIEREVDTGLIDLPQADAGVYRVEVFLLHHPLLPANVPWIVSNPIFIGSAHSTRPHTELYSKAVEIPKPDRVARAATPVSAAQ